ncbi:MAG: hypothetical protein J6580_11640 [Gilliamella sp.]|uniref:hypothetical protein n=1 Tax=Gilliamella sp. TaxID=1891236 RepID=UPI0025E9EA15|nr:hypothetical protein [Gilliamella sp.]MCO6551311.1 hypothetical protein [Gilliamella sp.]
MKKSRYYLMLIVNLFLVLSLTGCFCSGKFEVLSESLPNAAFGKPYYAEININVGVVRSDSYHIKPENSGLELSPSYFDWNNSYNDFTIKGTPKVNGTISIEFTGTTYVTMRCPASQFKKIYTIKVEE